jgi:hypothetical protein
MMDGQMNVALRGQMNVTLTVYLIVKQGEVFATVRHISYRMPAISNLN